MDDSRRCNETLRRAVSMWGEDAQITMALEELGELQTELARFWRGRAVDADVVEEVADVQIMTRQLAIIFGEDAVENVTRRKLARLDDRLDDTEDQQ